MPNCCGSSGCSCVITGGGGVSVTGTGTTTSPYIVSPGGITPRFLPGAYIMNAGIGGGEVQTFAMTANSLYALPLYVHQTTSFDRWATSVGTAAGGALLRVGVYNVNHATGALSTLVVDAGTFDCSTTGDKFATIAITLTPGTYMVVAVTNSGTARFRGISGATNNPFNIWMSQNPSVNEDSPKYRTFTGYSTGSLPPTATAQGAATVEGADFPGFFLRSA